MKPKQNLGAPAWVRAIRTSSFFNKAPQLFNILPLELRHPKFFDDPTQKLQDAFKSGVDKYLSTVPDQPTIQDLHRAALTNSILFQDAYKTPVPGGSYLPAE